MVLEGLRWWPISVLVLFTIFGLANACAPPYPSYRLHLTVTSGNALVVGASVFVFNQNEGIESIPIQHTYTDSGGEAQFSLGPKKYDIMVVWSNTYTVKENVSVPFAGAYITINISSKVLEATVFDKCYNWLPWTFGILVISLIIGTFCISVGLKTSWKKAIGYSFLINIPSVVIGVVLCILL